jgi:pimeloyl-ACP methyl ester carboxylesterase
VIPITQYARTDDGTHIAYSITGDGPIDVLLCTEWTFNLDLATEHPALTRLIQRLAQGSRVISMNRRGIGASDPVPVQEMATLESWVEDVAVVLDRVGSARAAVLGVGHGGHVAMVLAATRPERVSHLVLVDAYARAAVGPDYPFGYSEEALERYASARVAQRSIPRCGPILTSRSSSPNCSGSPPARVKQAASSVSSTPSTYGPYLS